MASMIYCLLFAMSFLVHGYDSLSVDTYKGRMKRADDIHPLNTVVNDLVQKVATLEAENSAKDQTLADFKNRLSKSNWNKIAVA